MLKSYSIKVRGLLTARRKFHKCSTVYSDHLQKKVYAKFQGRKKKKSMALAVYSENKLSGSINYVCWGRVVLKNVLTFFVVLIFSTVCSYS